MSSQSPQSLPRPLPLPNPNRLPGAWLQPSHQNSKAPAPGRQCRRPFPLTRLDEKAAEGLTLGEYFSPLKGSPGLANPGFSLPSADSTTSFSSGLLEPWLPWLGLLQGEEPFPHSGNRRHEKTHQSAGRLAVTWPPPSSGQVVSEPVPGPPVSARGLSTPSSARCSRPVLMTGPRSRTARL